MTDAELLAQLLDALSDLVYFKDAQGRYLRVNRALAAWYGLKDPAEAVGKTDFDFHPEGFARSVAAIDSRIVQGGEPVIEQEETVVGRDGKKRWLSTSKVPLRGADGAVAGTLGISRDLKGVKRAEEKARDSEALYQSLIEALPQCIFRKDVDGRYVYVNQRLCEMMGYSPKDMLGKTDYDVCPKALADKYRRDDQWVMSRQKLFEDVEELKAKRKRIQIRVFKTPVYDSKGRVVGVQGVFSPI
jgi:two-component system, sensor histidine kinase and response regulator